MGRSGSFSMFQFLHLKNNQVSALRSLPSPKCLPSSSFVESLSPPSLPRPPAVSTLIPCPGLEQIEMRNKENGGLEVPFMLIEAEVGE